MDSAAIPSLSEELPWIDFADDDDWLAEPTAKAREEGIDKREFRGDPSDFGWIGEDDNGIWLKRHPEAALTEHPELWWVVHRWSLGQHEVTREDTEGLSNHEMEQLATMASAHGRELKRRTERHGGSQEAEDSD